LSQFTADWLALREPADIAARSLRLTRRIGDVVADARMLRVLDLGAGTGANARYLIEQLAIDQSWTLADADATLLAQALARMRLWGVERGYRAVSQENGLRLHGTTFTCDLATARMNLASIEDSSIFSNRQLVTASALLDLVSERWLRGLAKWCRDVRATVLFALTYDGRTHCSPEEPDDALVRDLVNQHQQTEKGFGIALGPDAASAAERCLAAVGYEVRRERSDWVLPPAMDDLQRQLIDTWARAAFQIAPDAAEAIRRWQMRRLAHVDEGRSRMTVGHEDIAAWVP
jgi:hypothetical protein